MAQRPSMWVISQRDIGVGQMLADLPVPVPISSTFYGSFQC